MSLKMSQYIPCYYSGPTTYISDIDGGDEDKSFSFDYSYWSFDEFEDVDGYLTPSSDKYDDQVIVISYCYANLQSYAVAK